MPKKIQIKKASASKSSKDIIVPSKLPRPSSVLTEKMPLQRAVLSNDFDEVYPLLKKVESVRSLYCLNLFCDVPSLHEHFMTLKKTETEIKSEIVKLRGTDKGIDEEVEAAIEKRNEEIAIEVSRCLEIILLLMQYGFTPKLREVALQDRTSAIAHYLFDIGIEDGEDKYRLMLAYALLAKHAPKTKNEKYASDFDQLAGRWCRALFKGQYDPDPNMTFETIKKSYQSNFYAKAKEKRLISLLKNIEKNGNLKGVDWCGVYLACGDMENTSRVLLEAEKNNAQIVREIAAGVRKKIAPNEEAARFYDAGCWLFNEKRYSEAYCCFKQAAIRGDEEALEQIKQQYAIDNIDESKCIEARAFFLEQTYKPSETGLVQEYLQKWNADGSLLGTEVFLLGHEQIEEVKKKAKSNPYVVIDSLRRRLAYVPLAENLVPLFAPLLIELLFNQGYEKHRKEISTLLCRLIKPFDPSVMQLIEKILNHQEEIDQSVVQALIDAHRMQPYSQSPLACTLRSMLIHLTCSFSKQGEIWAIDFLKNLILHEISWREKKLTLNALQAILNDEVVMRQYAEGDKKDSLNNILSEIVGDLFGYYHELFGKRENKSGGDLEKDLVYFVELMAKQGDARGLVHLKTHLETHQQDVLPIQDKWADKILCNKEILSCKNSTDPRAFRKALMELQVALIVTYETEWMAIHFGFDQGRREQYISCLLKLMRAELEEVGFLDSTTFQLFEKAAHSCRWTDVYRILSQDSKLMVEIRHRAWDRWEAWEEACRSGRKHGRFINLVHNLVCKEWASVLPKGSYPSDFLLICYGRERGINPYIIDKIMASLAQFGNAHAIIKYFVHRPSTSLWEVLEEAWKQIVQTSKPLCEQALELLNCVPKPSSLLLFGEKKHDLARFERLKNALNDSYAADPRAILVKIDQFVNECFMAEKSTYLEALSFVALKMIEQLSPKLAQEKRLSIEHR